MSGIAWQTVEVRRPLNRSAAVRSTGSLNCATVGSDKLMRKYAIPVLMRLYLNTKTNTKLGRKHRKKTDLMLEMIHIMAEHAAGKPLHFLGDSAYTGGRMLEQIPDSVAVTGRIGPGARLYQGPPPKKPGRGRPPRRGAKLPQPIEMLAVKGLRRAKINLYSRSSFFVRITSVVCRLYLASEREVKVVAVEHLRGGRGIEVFYSTDLSLSEEEVLERYSFRWPVETTFQDSKGHLGLGEPQNRVRAAVCRTTPSMLYLYGLIVLWHELIREEPDKRQAAFADMLATPRRDSVEETRETILSAGRLPPAAEKLLKPLKVLLSLAA